MSTSYIYGTGRRKTSVARVRLLPGDGQIVVNGKDVAEYFGGTGGAGALRLPFRVTETEGRYSASVLVAGGGFSARPAPFATASPARCSAPIRTPGRRCARRAC